ncbi:MAG: AraC family transcriptional regulator [Clostridiales bacterium]|jgi:AraC-like DNA-binding protein|nr:AraC family transcriptional regulator [Clostridiales bacterium]
MAELKSKELLQLNPYVRHVQQINGTDQDYYMPWRVIYDFFFLYVERGEYRIMFDDKTVDIAPKQLFIIPPMLRHKQVVPKACTYYGAHADLFYDDESVDFSPEEIYIEPIQSYRPIAERPEEIPVIDRLARRVKNAKTSLVTIEPVYINNIAFAPKFKALLDAFSKDGYTAALETKAILLEMIAILLNESISSSGEQGGRRVISEFINFAIAHFNEDIDVIQLAKDSGYAPNYFRRMFKKVTNRAPHEYIINLRMEEAKKLLRGREYTVREISSLTGYEDMHYFSRLFKQREGIPPAQYRLENRE